MIVLEFHPCDIEEMSQSIGELLRSWNHILWLDQLSITLQPCETSERKSAFLKLTLTPTGVSEPRTISEARTLVAFLLHCQNLAPGVIFKILKTSSVPSSSPIQE